METKYGLMNKKNSKLLGVSIYSNNGSDFANDNRYDLEENSDELWLMDTYESVKRVYDNPSTKWYNSDYYSPCYDFDMKDYSIVEVSLYITKVME